MSEYILSSIKESSPCGADYKYEDAFLNIETEIDKTNSMLEGTSTDWNVVESSSLDLLQNHTKDIKVFSWWVYATWKKESWTGLKKTLELFNELLLKYGNKLFPKSIKVKKSSLIWLEDLIYAEVLDDRGKLNASIDAKIYLELFEKLQKSFSLCVEEDIELFRKLQNELKRIIKEEVSNNKAKQTSSSPQSKPDGLNEINSPDDAKNVMRSLKKTASLLQKYYRAESSSDLRAIRLVRMISRVEVDGLPMNENGKTFMNPPPQNNIDRINELIAEKKFKEALDKTENIISVSPFWFDGHYLSFEILTQLSHVEAADEVKATLFSYIQANDKIFDLTYKDSTPLVSAKLTKWISQNMISSSVEPDDNEDQNTTEQLIQNCYALARKKKIKEAMGLLQSYYNSAVNKEDKFHWRLVNAELAAEFGKTDLAIALLEDLKKDIDRYNLDEWKPELAAKVFSLFLSFKRNQLKAEHINAAYTRLCKIDIEQALEIKL